MTTGWAPTVEQLEPAKDANALTEVRSLLERMVMAYSPAGSGKRVTGTRSSTTNSTGKP